MSQTTKNKPRMGHIYGLTHPKTGRVYYIGKAFDLKIRLAGHMKPSELKNATLKNNWIKSLLRKGYGKPGIKSLLTCPEDKLNYHEKRLIKIYRKKNSNLKNGTDGGDGGKTTELPSNCVAVCCSNGREYPSIHAAARHFKVTQGAISNCVNRKTLSCKGLRFWKKGTKPVFRDKKTIGKPIHCNNGRTYVNIRAASKDTKVIEQIISDIVNRKRTLGIKGLSFAYIGDPLPKLTENNHIRKIKCTNGQIYDTIKDCAKDIGGSAGPIIEILKGRRYFPYHGLNFAYVNAKFKTLTPRKSPIYCNNGQVYETIRDAAIDLNVSESSISNFLSGKQKSAILDKFTFSHDPNKLPPITVCSRGTPIICSNGIEYSSAVAAAKDLKISSSAICRYLENNKSTPVARKHTFSRTGDGPPPPVDFQYSQSKPVYCSNGIVYKSIGEANRKLDLPVGALNRFLHGKRKYSINGLTFSLDQNHIPDPNTMKTGIRKIACSNGIIYETISDCCRELGLQPNEILAIITGKKNTLYNGLNFTTEGTPFRTLKQGKPPIQKIRCKNDGKLFDSIIEAAKFYKINRQTIARNINHGKILACGLIFKKA